MPEAFSFNREFDFVRLDGLSRVTGRPPHEWDIYIIKELIDNALDADEVLWAKEASDFPKITVKVEYIELADNRQQLIVQVENRAIFPPELIQSVFDPGWYTSRKAFVKGLTRGSLGNALKTLLGIPYALRMRATGDLMPQLKPLSIQSKTKEYLPRYIVDSASQVIKLEIEEGKTKGVQGTIIRIGVDHFSQEIPRRLEDIQQLAEQYHWCNPHAEFSWKIELNGIGWNVQYPNNPDWNNKYKGIAPIHWYSPTSFQDLINALFRKQFGNKTNGKLEIKDVVVAFNDKENNRLPTLITAASKELSKTKLSQQDIEADSTNLYRFIFQNSPKFDSIKLGGLGEGFLQPSLVNNIKIDGNILYSCVNDHQDPNIPFVLEIYAARLKVGKRQIWTAINFTPTYGDPFFRRWLDTPTRPEDPVLGLRGFMDAYGFTEDTPILIYLHLICPTIEHAEYSKTEINHLPFKNILGNCLDGLLNELIQMEQEKELKIEQTISHALDEILESLQPDEQFVPDQLLERLRKRLSQVMELVEWLDSPGAIERLRSSITKYQSNKPVVTHWARTSSEITIPSHPDKHFFIPAAQVNGELLKAHHVNKIIYLQAREIEPVVIENGWLSQMDMALLQNPSNPADLEQVIVHCLAGSDVPLLILHNADDAGFEAVKKTYEYLDKRKMKLSRIIDLGLTKNNDQANRPTRLVEYMPSELATWLLDRLKELGIPLKSTPPFSDIRKDIRSHFDRLLLSYLWESMYQELEITNLMDSIDQSFDILNIMKAYSLDQNILEYLKNEGCKDSYETILQTVVNRFYEDFMKKNDKRLNEIIKLYLEKGRE